MTSFITDIFQNVLHLTNSIIAVVVLWASICALNAMTPRSLLPLRLAYIFLGVGAAAMLLGPVYFDHRPTLGGTIMAIGVVILVITERLYARRLESKYRRRLGYKHNPRHPWWG